MSGPNRKSHQPRSQVRRLVVVLGDQLDRASPALDGFDASRDLIWMAEVDRESDKVWSHKARIALFLAAMRHYRDDIADRGWPIVYHRLGTHAHESLGACLEADLRELAPQTVRMVHAGEWQVGEQITRACEAAGVELEILEDTHFLLPLSDFEDWLRNRREPRLEHFYRFMRKRTGLLMQDGEPVGGAWNFDRENRGAFGRNGPMDLPGPRAFPPDATTREVLALVAERFAGHPGELADFDWPVTPEQAQSALDDFIEHRLASFGRFQDAMWTDAPFLYHACLSAALNLKLISPRHVLDAVAAAYERGDAPIESVEGFVRQILGWREYVRGIYWTRMPEYLERNELGADAGLPDFYWNGATDFVCLQQVVGQTLARGYAHHIQRLMVTGLFALLLGVDPRRVHEWYLAVYVDAVEWVELPNTLGMSQYADGGLMASKPYAASGKYIQRMSNYCGRCRYDPSRSTGDRACPFTTLYWDFLMRHEKRLADHPRMALQVRNLARLDDDMRRAIRRQSDQLRSSLCAEKA
jgi:deoxyribodipyrimidine photolyase-related protein